MSDINSYFTIKDTAEGIYKDRGSKFIAYAFAIGNEEDIKIHLQEVRKQHPSARHHCYAWRINPEKEVTRANDDGEPSGSAGKPILNQLTVAGLYNVLIIVVRYFGGTLLGVNGLVNAYKMAAVDAINNSHKVECFVISEYEISFEAFDQGAVMRVLKDLDAKIIQNNYSDKQEIIFQVKKQYSGQAVKKFEQLYKTKLSYLRTI